MRNTLGINAIQDGTSGADTSVVASGKPLSADLGSAPAVAPVAEA